MFISLDSGPTAPFGARDAPNFSAILTKDNPIFAKPA
jgi:hypothetical protein